MTRRDCQRSRLTEHSYSQYSLRLAPQICPFISAHTMVPHRTTAAGIRFPLCKPRRGRTQWAEVDLKFAYLRRERAFSTSEITHFSLVQLVLLIALSSKFIGHPPAFSCRLFNASIQALTSAFLNLCDRNRSDQNRTKYRI